MGAWEYVQGLWNVTEDSFFHEKILNCGRGARGVEEANIFPISKLEKRMHSWDQRPITSTLITDSKEDVIINRLVGTVKGARTTRSGSISFKKEAACFLFVFSKFALLGPGDTRINEELYLNFRSKFYQSVRPVPASKFPTSARHGAVLFISLCTWWNHSSVDQNPLNNLHKDCY